MRRSRHEYLYGINPVREAVLAGKRRIVEAYLDSTRMTPRLFDLVALLEDRGIPVHRVDRRRVNDLASHKEHQGIVLKVQRYPYCPSERLFGRRRLLLLDGVGDPHNVGGILRSAEVFGWEGVLLSNRGVPEIYPSIVKVSAGATEYLDIACDAPAETYAAEASRMGYRIIALEAEARTDIRQLHFHPETPLLLVVGGEDAGISDGVLGLAEIVSIPESGRIHSLNVAVAAGIALFWLGLSSSAMAPRHRSHGGGSR